MVERLEGEDVVAPDLEIGDDLWDTARRLGAAAGRGTYVGYSMGGRVALHLALDRPDLVERLVLLGATAGIEDDAERAARRAEDEARAREIETGGVEPFLERWLAQPMFAGLADRGARCTDAGVLTASLRRCGTGTQAPLWHRLGRITAPVLVLAGERDAKFAALAQRLADALPDATFALVPDAGHAAHLERPDAVARLLQEWLSH